MQRETTRNPYIIDRPLAELDEFFGREDVFSWIEDGLRAGERVLVVSGPRRIGKTSLLAQLPARLFALYAPVTVSFVEREGESAPELLDRILSEVQDQVLHRWGAGLLEDDEFSPDVCGDPDAVLSGLVSALGDRRLLICCDDLAAEDVNPVVRQAAETLMSLTDDGLRVLLCMESAPDSAIDWERLHEAPAIELGYLSESASEDLLIRPTLNRLAYDYDAVRQVYLFTSGHPYFTQLFGYFLYEQRETAGWVGIYDVMTTAPRIVEYGEDEFERIWQRCSSDVKMALAGFGALKGSPGIATAHEIYHALRRERVQMTRGDVENALRKAEEAGILGRLGATTYRFNLELFWLWLRDHAGVSRVLKEVRRYRRGAASSKPFAGAQRVNWGGLFLWIVAIALGLMVAFVWRSRELQLVSEIGPRTTGTITEVILKPTVTPSPTLPPAPFWSYITYMAKETPADTWDVWIMRSDGTDPQRLTRNDANDTVPSWSPDGRQIVFVSDRDGNSEIYTMNRDGNLQVNLTAHPAEDRSPSWAADGSRIAFSSYRDGNWEIYVMNSDGSEPIRLTGNESADYSPVWSPDATRLAFVSKRDGNWEIYVMNADGTDPVRLTYDEATDYAPVWSPDGSKLAFETYRDGDMEVYIMNADGSDPVNVTRNPKASDHGPTWSGDGQHIAYFSNQEGGWDILVADLEGNTTMNLTLSQATEQMPSWEPWGRR